MESKKAVELKNLKPLLGKFTISASDTVLDAGCGYGARTKELSKDVGAHVISIDFSLSCLKAVNQELDKTNIDLIQADLQNLPLKDLSVDKIVSGDVLEHVPNVPQTLKGFQRVIKKNGKMFLLVPSSVSQKLFIKLDNTYSEHTGHLRTFESKQFINLIRSADFVVLDSYHAEIFRAIYHLLQTLSKTRIEHQTGRVVKEDNWLFGIWSASRLLYFSWIGDLIEAFGKFIFPNSFVVISIKK
jgi:ubiquinone/menaquinone biosynthesis C-methylase UbiE